MSAETPSPGSDSTTVDSSEADATGDASAGDEDDGDAPPARTPELTTEFLRSTPGDVDSDAPPHGFDLLYTIERDHRFCANCFKKKKDVEEPPEWADVNDCVIGWAWPHEHVETEFLPRTTRSGEDGTLKPTMVCSCGTASSTTRRRPVSVETAKEYASSLSAAAWELHYEYRNRAVTAADEQAWRDMRIAGALAHDPDALEEAIEHFKRKPELTATNMQGDWYDDDLYPDELYRRAFSVAAKRPPESCLTASALDDVLPPSAEQYDHAPEVLARHGQPTTAPAPAPDTDTDPE